MDISVARCASCRFWRDTGLKREDIARLGECRRRAPRLVGVERDNLCTRWPFVAENDMCGEHTRLGVSGEPLQQRQTES